jgi:hypothetical protein
MRRFRKAAIASSLLALAIPAAALAHDAADHEPAQHEAAHHPGVHHHRRHHRRAHTVLFAHGITRTTPGTSTPVTTTPAPVADEPAGTIASFDGGVLKITLADGSTVSGTVTQQTRIECRADDRDDFDRDGGDGRGGPGPSSGHDDFGRGDDERGGDQGDDHGGDGEVPSAGCDQSALTPGAEVAEAELVVTSAGSFWESVELTS